MQHLHGDRYGTLSVRLAHSLKAMLFAAQWAGDSARLPDGPPTWLSPLARQAVPPGVQVAPRHGQMHVWATTHYPGTAQHQALLGVTLDFYVDDPRVEASAGPSRTEGSPEGRNGMDAFDEPESTVTNSDGRLRATVATVRACDTLSSTRTNRRVQSTHAWQTETAPVAEAWSSWHHEYDEPHSPLAIRLAIVRDETRQALALLPEELREVTRTPMPSLSRRPPQHSTDHPCCATWPRQRGTHP